VAKSVSEVFRFSCLQQAMSSALELVKVCVDWAVAKKIYNADPVEGPWSCFSGDEMQKKFEGGHA